MDDEKMCAVIDAVVAACNEFAVATDEIATSGEYVYSFVQSIKGLKARTEDLQAGMLVLREHFD